MSAPVLATKLYIPPQPNAIHRSRLAERLNEGLHRKLILISAPAGFGKTTLISDWVNQQAEGGELKAETGATLHPSPFTLHPSRVAWLSLDEGDNDLPRFLTYLVAALQTIAPHIGAGVLNVLHSPQPPSTEAILTALLNDITTVSDHIILVLDDYHVIEAQPVDQALTFLLEHLPPQIHLVIMTREDPPFPLARLRARGHLTELRAADLRFTLDETTAFFNQMMGLQLTPDAIAALDTRTEGWIAGLHLAALSLQGKQDATSFITSFTGSHRFVMDYLVEEVLNQQPDHIQTFLLHTSILNRLCGPLCDAVVGGGDEGLGVRSEIPTPDPQPLIPSSSQEVLMYLERVNLFIVPLDNERRWYRYHHLFAELLRQRLHQSLAATTGDAARGVAELHRRASIWYEAHGLELGAFHHAAAAGNVVRAARLIEGKGMPLHFRGAVIPVLNWLKSLPATVLDAHPALWVMYASVLSITGQNSGVEQKLQAAEAALHGAELDDKTRNLIGHIAAIRALLAALQYQVDTIIAQSRRALEYLAPDNLAVRTATTWKLGLAYQFQGDRAAASQAYTEAIASSEASGNIFINIVATTGLGIIQESENQLTLASETYRRVLHLVGDPPQPTACEAYLGLARLSYQWNDLEAAQQHGQRSLQLARQIEMIDSFVAGEVFLARLKLAQGDVAGAAALLAKADQAARRHNFVQQMPEIAAAQVLTLLHQGNLTAAATLAQTHEIPIRQAQVHLAQGDPSAALAVLEPWQQKVEAKGWADEWLKVLVLQAVAHHAGGETDQALALLGEALALAEPGGFIRTFVDEGEPIADLLTRMKAKDGRMKEYIHTLLAAFGKPNDVHPSSFNPQLLIEPLSQRELEILHLIAQGLSNREISERLVLALDTVKGHNRRIYDKLHVQRRTEAVARARELGLL